MTEEQRRAYNRAQKARRRHADNSADTQPVDNADNADKIADRFADIADRFADKLAVILSQFAQDLAGALPRETLKGFPIGREQPPVRANEKRGHADTRTNADTEPRTWTNSFTARPGEIPRCEGCDHLIVNCQCEWEQHKRERLDLA